jgi:hypothetical protein
MDRALGFRAKDVLHGLQEFLPMYPTAQPAGQRRRRAAARRKGLRPSRGPDLFHRPGLARHHRPGPGQWCGPYSPGGPGPSPPFHQAHRVRVCGRRRRARACVRKSRLRAALASSNPKAFRFFFSIQLLSRPPADAATRAGPPRGVRGAAATGTHSASTATRRRWRRRRNVHPRPPSPPPTPRRVPWPGRHGSGQP